MNFKTMRIVLGVTLLAGCCSLMQGCKSSKNNGTAEEAAVVPEEQPAVEATATTPAAVEPAPAASTEVKPVAMTTAYTVKKGDTISGIAARYNLRWQDVVAVNPGLSPNKIRVGKVIQLPGQVDLGKCCAAPKAAGKGPKASAPSTTAPAVKGGAVATGSSVYVVKKGDFLAKIAKEHHVKIAVLRSANNLNGDRIRVGQKLRIPGAAAVKAAPAKAEAHAKKAGKAAAPAPVAKKHAAPAEVKAPVAPAPAPAAAEVKPAAGIPASVNFAEGSTAPVAVTPAAPAPAAAAKAAPAAAAAGQTYTVKEGEDLYAVAIRWGVSPADLKALNNLSSTELKAGTVLKIPNGAQQ